MIILASTSDLIQVITGSAATIDVHASWVDNNLGIMSPGRTNVAITTATSTTVVGSPASGIQRNVKSLVVRNKDASACDITIRHVGSPTVELYKQSLAAGGQIQLTERGFAGAFLPLTGGTVTGNVAITSDTIPSSPITGALTVTGGIGIGGLVYSSGDIFIEKHDVGLFLNKTSGSATISAYTNGINRWDLGFGDSSSETGGNVGSDFKIWNYSDAGALLSTAIEITRATGNVIVSGSLGVGVTPSYTFHVKKDQDASTYIRVENTNTGSSATASVAATASSGSVALQAAPNFAQIASTISGTFTIANTTANPFSFTANTVELLRLNSNGNVSVPATFKVGAPTGTPSGSGWINAQAVYDDNVLLTCFGVQYLKHGAVDLAQWDAVSPIGKHGLAHKFVEMIEDFDPRDPDQYIARMFDDEALPGMPTAMNWKHGDYSVGDMQQRLWLAVELLASAFVGTHKRLRALEEKDKSR